MKNIIIIDDDQLFGESLSEEFEDSGYKPIFYSDPTQSLIQKIDLDIQYALIDLRLKNQTGLDFIDLINSKWPDCFIVIMTGFGTIATAVEAMKLGACDYLTKPVTVKKFEKLILGESSKKNHLDLEPDVHLSLDRMEREYIEHVLILEKGNISKTAEKLGLHRQSLQRKLKKWVPRR